MTQNLPGWKMKHLWDNVSMKGRTWQNRSEIKDLQKWKANNNKIKAQTEQPGDTRRRVITPTYQHQQSQSREWQTLPRVILTTHTPNHHPSFREPAWRGTTDPPNKITQSLVELLHIIMRASTEQSPTRNNSHTINNYSSQSRRRQCNHQDMISACWMKIGVRKPEHLR